MRKSLAFTIFLLALIGAFSIAQWGRLMEWWQSLTAGKRIAYASALYCAATGIVSRFVAFNPLLILAALMLLHLATNGIRTIAARRKK